MKLAWEAMKPHKQQCHRCGRYYPCKLTQCSHCGDLDDQGVQRLLQRHHSEQAGNARLGKVFIFIAVVLAALLGVALL